MIPPSAQRGFVLAAPRRALRWRENARQRSQTEKRVAFQPAV
jgi:hypothetical protein